MRKYLLPLLLLSAIGAVVVVVILANRERDRDQPEQAEEPRKEAPEEPKTGLKPAKTPTSLQHNRALRELERLLQKEDLPDKAHYYRQLVCSQMDQILDDKTLTKNLLDAIRKHGTESDDEKRRKLMLPILRVFATPEATQLIAQEYYEAKNDEERMILLEAMAHKYHDPETASVWAVDRALNSEDPRHRALAFDFIRDRGENDTITFKTAEAIYDGTTRANQRKYMIETIVRIAEPIPDAVNWLRKRLKEPRPDEIHDLISYMDSWGTPEDAQNLDKLANAYPGMGDILRQRAEEVRLAYALRTGDADTIAKARHEKELREKQREAERLKAEEEKKRNEGG